jgi:hypothetical protein
MNNLGNLYETDMAFADIVDEAAAAAIGTTNVEFAREWLMMDAPGEQAGDAPGEDMRAEVAHLEARVEHMRGQLGSAADLAGAILRTCMDCTDYEGGVVA